MTPLKSAIGALKIQAVAIAKTSGKADQLATQEVNAALKAGTISKAERDVLQRALSDSGQSSVKGVLAELDKYEQAFDRTDTDGDGSVSKAERLTAQANWDNWMQLQATYNTPKADVAAARAETVQVDWMSPSGKKVTSPISNPNSLMQKLDRVLDERDASLVQTNMAAAQHKTLKEIAENLKAG